MTAVVTAVVVVAIIIAVAASTAERSSVARGKIFPLDPITS